MSSLRIALLVATAGCSDENATKKRDRERDRRGDVDARRTR